MTFDLDLTSYFGIFSIKSPITWKLHVRF